jgi:hypothetical protein
MRPLPGSSIKPRRRKPRPTPQRNSRSDAGQRTGATTPVRTSPGARRRPAPARPTAPAFRQALPGAALERQQRQQRRKSRRARRRLPSSPGLPILPILRNPTPAQAISIDRITRNALARIHRQTGKGNAEIFRELKPVERRRLRAATRANQQVREWRRLASAIEEIANTPMRPRPRLPEIYGPPTPRPAGPPTPLPRVRDYFALPDVEARPNVAYRSPESREEMIQRASRSEASLAPSRRAAIPFEAIWNLARVYAEDAVRPDRTMPSVYDADRRFAQDAVAGLAKLPWILGASAAQDASLGPLRPGGGSAVGNAAEDLWAATKEDYSARWSPALRADWEEFRRIARERGGAPTALDLAGVGAVGLKLGGLAGKTGALGGRAETYLNRPRAMRQVAPGELRRQRSETDKLMPNPLRVATQRRRDLRREQQAERLDVRRRQAMARERRADPSGRVEGRRRANLPDKEGRGERPGARERSIADLGRRATRGERKVRSMGGTVVKDRRGRVDHIFIPESAGKRQIDAATRSLRAEGWVVRRANAGPDGQRGVRVFAPRTVVSRERLSLPLSKDRVGVPTFRLRERLAQRKLPAGLKGASLIRFKQESDEAQRIFDTALKDLSRHERAALFLAATGLTSADNPASALRHLDELEEYIKANRGDAERFFGAPQTDNLRTIRYLRDHVDEAFTPRLAAAIEEIRPLVEQMEEINPRLHPDQVARARVGPQADLLDVEPGSVRVELADPDATRKSIERHARKGLRPAERRARRAAERANRLEGEAVRLAQEDQLRPARGPGAEAFTGEERAQLQDQLGTRSEAVRRAREAYEAEARRAQPIRDNIRELEKLARRARERGDSRAYQDQLARAREQLAETLPRQEKLYAEMNRAQTRLDELRSQISGRLTGQPEKAADEVTWFHGTPRGFDALPTAEGMPQDLGVYLTSDPAYAAAYAGGSAPATQLVHVSPKRVLETRFGKADPAEIVRVIEGLLDQERRVLERIRPITGELKARRAEAARELLPLRKESARAARRLDELQQQLRARGGLQREVEAATREYRAARDAYQAAVRERRLPGGPGVERLIDQVESGRLFSQHVRETLDAHLRGLRDVDSDYAKAAAGRLDDRARAQEMLPGWQEMDRVIMRETGPELKGVLAEARQAAEALGLPAPRVPSRRAGATRTVLMRLGYDAVRKADTYADALVVLNEKVMQAPGRGLGPRARAAAVQAAEAKMLAEATRGSVAQLRSKPRPAVRSTEATRPEITGEFVRRVRDRARETGRPTRPLFAPSEEFGARRFADYTVGGTQLVRGPKRRKYVLQRKGKQRMTPEVIFEGIQRNIKQRHNAELIMRTFDRLAHPKARRMSAQELKRFIEREGIDLSQVAIWFPGRFEEGLRRLGEAGEEMRAAGQRVKEGDGMDPGGDAGGVVLPDDSATVGLMRDSIVKVDNLRALDAALEKFEGEGGTIVPRAAYNEIFSSTKGDTQAGRVMQRLSSLQSRAVLGTLNVNWLLADTMANGAMAFLMEGVTPVEYARGISFMRRMPEHLRREIDSELDIGRFKSQTYIPHMGSTANSAFVNRWRALRSIPPGTDARPLTRAAGAALRARPIQRGIDQFLRLERTVANIPPRQAVFYKLLRDEAFRRMDEEIGAANRLTNRLVGHFTKSPEKMMLDLLEDKGMVEELGRRVDNALGDYQSFTSIERRTIGRLFFFYPYARFAIRALFYTLPVEHPIRMSVAMRLGSLTEQEQRELLGVGEDEADDLRSLMFGRAVYRDEKGELKEFNVRTVNPFGNPITESKGSESILGVLPPVYQWALGQIEKRDIYRDQPWNIGGEFTRPTTDPKLGDGLLEAMWNRSKILARNLIELPVPSRELAKHLMPGPQSSESLPFPGMVVPLRHKDPKMKREDEAKALRDAEETFAEQIMRSQLRLFVSKPSDILGQIDRRRTAIGLEKPKPKGSGKLDLSKATVPGRGSGGLDLSKATVPGAR